MATRRSVHYTRVPNEDNDDDFIRRDAADLRFIYSPKSLDRIPWKSIALAIFLLFLGSVLLFLSFFILAGHMEGDKSQAYGLMGLGILAFLPGFYETRIAYYSWRGAKGYRFSSIPDCIMLFLVSSYTCSAIHGNNPALKSTPITSVDGSPMRGGR